MAKSDLVDQICLYLSCFLARRVTWLFGRGMRAPAWTGPSPDLTLRGRAAKSLSPSPQPQHFLLLSAL